MLSELFINFSITSVTFFIAGQVLKNQNLDEKSSARTKILIGIGAGLLGTALMYYSIHTLRGVLIDLRFLAILTAAFYGGWAATAITTVIIVLFRIVLFGMSAVSIKAGIIVLLTGAGCACITILNINRRTKYIYMSVYCVIFTCAAIGYLLNSIDALSPIFLYFLPVSIFGATFSFFLCEYIYNSNRNYREMEYYVIMADNLTDLVTTHKKDMTVSYVSSSCTAITGHSANELIGTSWFDIIHPDDSAAIRNMFNDVFNAAGTHTLSYRIRKKDNSYIWIESTSKFIKSREGRAAEIIAVSRDITIRKLYEEKLIEANRKLMDLSYIDGLTHVNNRRCFDRAIKREWGMAHRNSKCISLIFIDIDFFKNYNDTYGHLRGDDCLKIIAGALSETVSRAGDSVSRYGGEEFAIILQDTNAEGAAHVAQKIVEKVAQMRIINISSPIAPYVTISAGISSTVPKALYGYEEFIEAADRAMYNAKKNGRNRYEVFEMDMQLKS